MAYSPFNGRFPLILAPMAGYTDGAFRRLCREHGADLTVTEMISAKAVHYNDKKTAALARISGSEVPCLIQIFGSEPDIMAESAKRLADLTYTACETEIPPSGIDINMGCPVRKVVASGDGSALMKDPGLIHAIVDSVSKAVDIPVSVKIRTGFDGEHVNAVECAKAAEAGGASFICVHGRTREQMYSPPVDRETIAKVKESVRIPVIANGGIFCAADALSMIRETGCDGLAVARGALGNPFIFEEIASTISGKEYIPPSDEERLLTAAYHLKLLIADKGEREAALQARSQLIWYTKGMRGAVAFRGTINRCAGTAEMFALIDETIKLCKASDD